MHRIIRRGWPGEITLTVVWVIVVVLFLRPQLHGFDTVAYYSWLRSVVIQGNLDVSDEFAYYGYSQERGLSPTGFRLSEWPVGSAIMWAPFFLAAHTFASVMHSLGVPVEANGYSWPYTLLVALGSATYALIALRWLYELAKEYAGEPEALWATLTAWLASPLIFYMSAHPFMAHSNDFFVNTLFFRKWARNSRPTWISRFTLGLVGGLATCVRFQNVSLLIWPLAEDWVKGVRGALEKRELLRRTASLLAGGLLGFSPQIAVWRIVFGRWLVLNPYGVTGAGFFDWRSPHFFDVLFSTNRGLFLWTPMALLGVWGIVRHLPRFQPRWSLFLIANFLTQVYIIGSWSSWSGAAAFGQRFLTNSVPAFGLGLAACYASWRPSLRRKGTQLIGVCLIGWNLVLLARYAVKDVPRMGPVPLKELLLGQFAFLVGLFGRLDTLLRLFLR